MASGKSGIIPKIVVLRGYIVAIAAAIALAIWHFGISPVYLLFTGGVIGVLIAACRGKEVQR